MKQSRVFLAAIAVIASSSAAAQSASSVAVKEGAKQGADFRNPIDLKPGQRIQGVGDFNLRRNIWYKLPLEENDQLTATLSDLPPSMSASGLMVIMLLKLGNDGKDPDTLLSRLSVRPDAKKPSVASLVYSAPVKGDYLLMLGFQDGGMPFELTVQVMPLTREVKPQVPKNQ